MPTRDGAEDRTRSPLWDVQSAATQSASVVAYPGLFSALLHVGRDAIWSWNDGIITSWNAEGEHLFGYTATEVVGRPLASLFAPDVWEQAGAILSDLKRGNWYREYDTVIMRKAGTPADVRLTISSIVDRHQNVIGGIAICRERRPRRQTAAILARRVTELTALFEFSERLQNVSALSDVYGAAITAFLTALRCDRAALLLFDDTPAMRFVAWHGLSDRYRAAVEGHSPWKPDAIEPQPIYVADIRQADEPDALKQIVENEGIRALAVVPLVMDGKLVGKIMSYYNLPHQFNEAEITLAMTIAQHMTVSMARTRAAELERTLTREVQHRSNNLLAVIQAIAQRSLSDDLNLHEAKKKFEGRLHALARAHHRVTQSNWSGVRLSALVRSELEPFSARANIRGPEVLLGPQQAQSFSLALHELATNAVKHGALSSAFGYIDVEWAIQDGDEVVFRWREHGGPVVVQPLHSGFGTTLLTSTFRKASFHYAREGLCYEVSVPLKALDSSSPPLPSG